MGGEQSSVNSAQQSDSGICWIFSTFLLNWSGRYPDQGTGHFRLPRTFPGATSLSVLIPTLSNRCSYFYRHPFLFLVLNFL